ncbi:MAG: MBL fold metallo-hydrolase [Christensenellaceae bacterium]
MLSSKNRKKIDIYSNEIVIDRLKKEIDSANLGENFGLHCVESYRTFHVGRRKITAFNAVHMPDERALLYFIEDGNRGYLHLYDTGEVKNEIAEWMQKRKSGGYSGIDCTFGTIEEKYFGHMNLKQAAEECES